MRLLNLDELDEGLGLGLEGLGHDETQVIAESAAVEEGSIIDKGLNLVNQTKEASL